MKTIKSVLVGALVALLGSSAWAAAETIDCGKVNVSQNSTNDLGKAYGPGKIEISVEDSTVDDDEVAKIVTTADGYVGITGAGRDGDTKVSLLSADGKKLYVYEVSAITITLSKTVKTWNDSNAPRHPKYNENNKSNATISIISHILNNPKPKIPNVLFFGTACDAHALSGEEVVNAINALRKIAVVDWYVFRDSTGKHEVKPGNSNPETKDVTVSDIGGRFEHSSHYSLKSFYDKFDEIIKGADSNKYDYVVIETDGSRLASEYNSSARAGGANARDKDQEKRVATWLKKFYDGNKVIWVFDDGFDYADYKTLRDPSDDEFKHLYPYGNDYGPYYVNNVTMKDNNYGANGWYAATLTTDAEWEGLLGVYAPSNYLAGVWQDESQTFEATTSASGGRGNLTTKRLKTTNPNQIFYGDPDGIADKISALIKPVEYTTDLADTVLRVQNLSDEDTMTIVDGADSVRLYKWTKSLTPGPQDDPYADGWTPIPAKDAGITVDWEHNSISNNVSGITNECYTLLQIDIVISDDFLKSAIAKKAADPSWPGIERADDYETSHKWKVNPNDGDAKITVWRGQGGAKVLAQTSAATMSNAWELPEENKTFLVDSADAEKEYDGYGTNIVIAVTNAELTVNDYTIQYRLLGEEGWHDYVDAAIGYTNVCDLTNVEYVVTGDGYADYTGTNTVHIWKRVLKDGAGPEHDRTGVHAVSTNLIYRTVLGPEDLMWTGGDGVLVDKGDALVVSLKSTNEVWDVNTYTNAIVTNAIIQVMRNGTEDVTGNYDIAFYPGTIWVWKRPVETNPHEPPSDPDPENPPSSNPPAAPANGNPLLWGPDIVKYYDGIPTNSFAQVHYDGSGSSFTVKYSTNEVQWVDYANLKLTDVRRDGDTVIPYKVFFRTEDSANFVDTNAYAFVTILPRPLKDPDDPENKTNGVYALDKEMVHGGPAPAKEWAGGRRLLPGDGIVSETVELCFTNDTDVTELPKGEYPGLISTNGTITITNATGDVTGNYVMYFTPGKLTVTPEKGYFKGFTDDPDDRIYKGSEWEPPFAVTNSVGKTLTKDDDYTAEYFDNVDRTNLAYVVVAFKGDYEGVVTNYFEILPRPVTLVSGDKAFTYDGEPHAWSNVTVKTGTGLYGFVEGEGVTTNTFATVTTVSDSGTENNTFEVSWNEGTLEKNYRLEKEYGDLTVEKAPIETMQPPPEEPQDPQPPEDPTPPTPPPAPESGNPLLWATNVVKYYDGIPTNIVADVYYFKVGNTFDIWYTTNTEHEADSVWSTKLDLTDVKRDENGEVASYQVWYRAKDGDNYIGTNTYAWVTILPRPLDDPENPGNKTNGVYAVDKEMAHGGVAPGLEWAGGKRLLKGDGIVSETVELGFTNDTNVAMLPAGEYPGLISTNVMCKISITNATGDVTGNYVMYFTPGKLTVKATAAMLTGRMRWKYQQADNSFWAALDVTCTNGDPKVLRSLCYVYEDRENCYLRNTNLMSKAKLSATSSETYGGKIFGKAVMDDSFVGSLRDASLNTTNRYGVSDTTLASPNDRVPRDEMLVALYATNRITLVRQETEAVEKSLGYLTWKVEGSETVYWCPLGEGLPPLPVDENPSKGTPLTVKLYNASVGYGQPAAALGNVTSLAIDEFAVSENRISGRVVTVSGDVRGIPGPNARLTVLGSATVGGPYTAVGTPELDGAGRFSMERPAGVTFFTGRLSLVDVVK